MLLKNILNLFQIDWFADQYKGMQRKLYTTEDQKAKVEFQEFLKGMKEFE